MAMSTFEKEELAERVHQLNSVDIYDLAIEAELDWNDDSVEFRCCRCHQVLKGFTLDSPPTQKHDLRECFDGLADLVFDLKKRLDRHDL